MTFSPSPSATVRRRGLPILSSEPVSHLGDSRMCVCGPHEGTLTHAHLHDLPNDIRGKDTMDNDLPKKMVRFDFPTGATFDQIAAAIRAAGERLMRERAEAAARVNDAEASPIEEKGQAHG